MTGQDLSEIAKEMLSLKRHEYRDKYADGEAMTLGEEMISGIITKIKNDGNATALKELMNVIDKTSDEEYIVLFDETYEDYIDAEEDQTIQAPSEASSDAEADTGGE